MPERVILSSAPEKYQPSAKAGMARCPQSLNQNVAHVDGAFQTKALEPLPSTGNQPSSMPKTMIRTSPTKKPGMESPSNATALPALSHTEFTFKAESIPNGTPSASETRNAAKPSVSEYGNRPNCTSRTGT